MKFHLLASGSKANSCLISSNKTKILIDCGGTQKYLKQALSEVDTKIDDIDALLITHTHSDHIGQLKLFQNTPTYAIEKLDCENFNLIDRGDTLIIGDISIKIIPTSHDSSFSCGFLINDGTDSLVYMTDTGFVSSKVQKIINNATYYVFESNHDVEMLMATNRPMHIKQRILSDEGHLSNQDSSDVLVDVVGDNTKEIILAHLSQEANDPDLAKKTLINKLNNKCHDIEVKVGKQFEVVSGGKYD